MLAFGTWVSGLYGVSEAIKLIGASSTASNWLISFNLIGSFNPHHLRVWAGVRQTLTKAGEETHLLRTHSRSSQRNEHEQRIPVSHLNWRSYHKVHPTPNKTVCQSNF